MISITVGVLTVLSEDDLEHSPDSVHFQLMSTANAVIEGVIVMDNIKDLPQAFCLLFGFTYALHLYYSRCMENTPRFTQTVLLWLGTRKLPR